MAGIPKLQNTAAKLISLICFIVVTVLECLVLGILILKKDAFCIRGHEITDELSIYLFVMTGIFISDIAYFLLILLAMLIKRCNFGVDINTIAFNIVAGILCFASIGKLALVESCGNEAFLAIKVGTCSLTTVSGIVHIVNGIFCLIFVAKDDRSLNMNHESHEL